MKTGFLMLKLILQLQKVSKILVMNQSSDSSSSIFVLYNLSVLESCLF